jgi:ribonuclease HI
VGTAIYYTKGGRRYRLRENARLEGLDSNNEAEYAALYFAMQKLEELGVNSQPVTITGDSLTVLNQLGGDWPCFEESHARFLARIEEKIASMRLKPLYKPVDRRHNKEADQLARQALEGTPISSHAEIGSYWERQVPRVEPNRTFTRSRRVAEYVLQRLPRKKYTA